MIRVTSSFFLTHYCTSCSYVARITEHRGYPFWRRLKKHTGCVNAVTFSHGDGALLASGGDDCRVLLWQSHNFDAGPVQTFHGHVANIFSLAFAWDNKYLVSTTAAQCALCECCASRVACFRSIINRHVVSCGRDCRILRHDLETGYCTPPLVRHSQSIQPTPSTLTHIMPISLRSTFRFAGHEDGVYRVSYVPGCNTAFLSASGEASCAGCSLVPNMILTVMPAVCVCVYVHLPQVIAQ